MLQYGLSVTIFLNYLAKIKLSSLFAKLENDVLINEDIVEKGMLDWHKCEEIYF